MVGMVGTEQCQPFLKDWLEWAFIPLKMHKVNKLNMSMIQNLVTYAWRKFHPNFWGHILARSKMLTC